jgi:DNA N6-methyl adenine demethylase
LQKLDSYVFCPECQKIFKGWDVITSCDQHSLDGLNFSGIFMLQNLLTSEDAKKIVSEVKWDRSQSGRSKKNYGPKVNFKKRKLRLEFFEGFSECALEVRKRLNDVEIIKDFKIVEECFLEYDVARGSHIEPHMDDCWIWGERIVTVNLIGETVLNFTKHFPTYSQQYNLDCIDEFKDQLIGGPLCEFIPDDILVRIPMPAQSLIVIYGSPRYQFEHSVLREDIRDRRVCIAYREFTKPYLHLSENFASSSK